MVRKGHIEPRTFRSYTVNDLDQIPQLQRLPEETRQSMKAVASVLPFRTNNYVVENLIDWDNIPNDPIYQLTFPQQGMLASEDFERILNLLNHNASNDVIQAAAREIQLRLNPHPAGQLELNRPQTQGKTVLGMQHKYRETVLFFPSQGQTCHAYCTYCFRWAQFVGLDDLKFANREADSLVNYLRENKSVHSVLFTGGDPLIMKTVLLRRYIEPLLERGLDHITSIRIGTKSTAYWPNRFLTDNDADDLMRLFEEVRAAGKHLALMSHFSHPVELETPEAQAAIKRIHATGAVIRCQAPLIRHVNDDENTWADMWRLQVTLGAIPYYMFVERDTGAKKYFEVPLARAYEIFQQAYRQVSGLSRTVRGPSMSATPGKVCVEGITRIHDEEVFVLKFLQARNPDWVGRPFFAKFDPEATWLDDLVPAFGEQRFFFEDDMSAIMARPHHQAWDVVDRRQPPVFIDHAKTRNTL